MDHKLPKQLANLTIALAVSSLLFRLWLGLSLPITVDESYFYWWGVNPDWGYYDHPPMVGWLNAAMLYLLGDTSLSIRLPAVILPLVVGAIIGWTFYPIDRIKATWAVILFWLTPLNWICCVITTDTPVIFWSMLSMAMLIRAELRVREGMRAFLYYALSGLFLGCAFLSKYFAVVLYLSYFVYFAIYAPRRWYLLLIVFAMSLPGPLINIWWNMGHGWANIMFNLYTRNKDEVFSWHKPALYLLTWIYLITPGVVWVLVRGWKNLKGFNNFHLLKILVLVPIFFFAILSIKKVIGLHWVLNFYPLCFALLAFSLPNEKTELCAKWMAGFAVLHLAILVGIATTSLSNWESFREYPQVVQFFRTKELTAKIDTPDAVLMATSYAPASLYGYTLKKYVPVFGEGTFHSRQDDLVVDFSVYAGKNIRVVTFEKPNLEEYKPYFDEVSTVQVEQNGVFIYAVQGTNFKYQAYKDVVLKHIKERYHQVPQWLLGIQSFFHQ